MLLTEGLAHADLHLASTPPSEQFHKFPASLFHWCILFIAPPPSLSFSFDRETVVRLQSENKMLCVQEETYRQKLVEVQAEMEEAQRSKNALETKNR